MPESLTIRIDDHLKPVWSRELTGSVELGRQKSGEDPPYACRQEAGHWRVVVASLEEAAIPRRQALIQPRPEGRILLENLSARVPVRLADGRELGLNASLELELPLTIALGSRAICIERAGEIRQPVRDPGAGQAVVRGATPADLLTLGTSSSATAETERLIRWMGELLQVIQGAAGSSEFFARAAQAMVDLIGLDSGRVLLYQQGEWPVVVVRTAPGIPPTTHWRPSHRVLERLLLQKQAVWEDPGSAELAAGSLMGIEAVAAAPILDREGHVIGALYGERRRPAGAHHEIRITRPEGLLLQLLAGGVAAGLARIEQEQAAAAARVQLEQFFTPTLARQIAVRPELLKGQDAEVTVLFADIRGFSRLSERLGPARTMEWIGDVMSELSECVLTQRGVLIDYIGDELMAMWGAPEAQADQTRLASEAALRMLDRLPDLTRRWQPVVGEPIQLGIGLSTGTARVGNTGTQRKFKYGPLGNTVNQASRVQGATKFLKVPLLVTGSTHAGLGEGFRSRRVGKVRLFNIQSPVELYELVSRSAGDPSDRFRRYEAALQAFEAGDFRSAIKTLGPMLSEFPDDGPSLQLLTRAVSELVEPSTKFDPVWRLGSK